jgi:hypothetical protein
VLCHFERSEKSEAEGRKNVVQRGLRPRIPHYAQNDITQITQKVTPAIFVASLSLHSPHHWVIEDLLEGRYDLCVSHDILLEYEEILLKKYGAEVASNFLKALQELPNVRSVTVYFQ